jgi:hypothetical protein
MSYAISVSLVVFVDAYYHPRACSDHTSILEHVHVDGEVCIRRSITCGVLESDPVFRMTMGFYLSCATSLKRMRRWCVKPLNDSLSGHVFFKEFMSSSNILSPLKAILSLIT